MWNGKKKAVTFGFDDGTTQDIRLIEILNSYNLKATFFLNSTQLGLNWKLKSEGVEVNHNKILPEQVRDLYKGHEVAGHTLSHVNLIRVNDEEVIRQVQDDLDNLSKLCGYEVIGTAYPGGHFDSRVSKLIREKTTAQYARTTKWTWDTSVIQRTSLEEYHPTIYYIEPFLEEFVQKFLDSNPENSQLLYIFGHSYELDTPTISWARFENLCKMLANRKDIFYGTNKEILL